MDMEQAPKPIREPVECDCGGSYVMFEGNRTCLDCGAVHGSGIYNPEEEPDEWEKWEQHRASEYSGWHGPERIKMVGGFGRAYDWGADPL